jgi:FPC/CPF motif-containing protein YcgG
VDPTLEVVGRLIEGQLRCMVLDGPFPCLGARSAFRNDSYVFVVHPDLFGPDAVEAVAADLRRFAAVRLRLGRLYSCIVSFLEPRAISDEQVWDGQVWGFLQALHELDDTPWDPRFSADPESGDFALSFAGVGHLVVSLYPGAWRYARRFAWPTLVFNPLEQDSDAFPEEQDFERFQRIIRARDARLQGQVNPSLPATRAQSQAPGFSGAPVPDSWRCPLAVDHQRSGGTEDDRRRT